MRFLNYLYFNVGFIVVVVLFMLFVVLVFFATNAGVKRNVNNLKVAALSCYVVLKAMTVSVRLWQCDNNNNNNTVRRYKHKRFVMCGGRERWQRRWQILCDDRINTIAEKYR